MSGLFNSSEFAHELTHEFTTAVWDSYKPYVIGAGAYCATSFIIMVTTLCTVCCCLSRFVIYVLLGCILWHMDAFICMAYFVTLLLFVIFGKSNPPATARAANFKGYAVAKGRDDKECRMPTDDNPFGNFMVTDFDDPERPPACDPEDVREEIDSKFYKNLYRNVDDLYEKESSARQFYTNPVTAVCNDQVEFARSLYQDMGSRRRHGMAY